jgi:CubicO group peptidase (beta-lactamase class C family)
MAFMTDAHHAPLISLDAVVDPVEPVCQNALVDVWIPNNRGYLRRWHFTNTTPNAAREWINTITIRHLIRHRAGLTRNNYIGFIQSPESLNADDPYQGMPSLVQCLDGFVRWPEHPRGFCPKVRVVQAPDSRMPALWKEWYLEDGTGWAYDRTAEAYRYNGKPGASEETASWKYSNGAYTVLQLIVEEKTGKSYPDFMQEKVFLPLDMNNTSYTIHKELNLAAPHMGNRVSVPYFLYTAKACGGLYTTAPDYAKFVQKLMESAGHDGAPWECDKVMEPSTYCIITTHDGATYRDRSFCREDKLGASDPEAASFLDLVGYIGDGETPDVIKKQRVYRHYGTVFGWNALMAFVPELKAGLLVFTNASSLFQYSGKGVCKEVFDAWVSTLTQAHGDEG